MAIGGSNPALDPTRDTLVNVSALGQPVPSARFMGGREYDQMRPQIPVTPTPDDATRVLRNGVMLLPAVVQDCGPFPHHRHRWTPKPATDAEREIALGYSLALTTATCLDLIGAQGPTLVEGPFAANSWYLSMLATATDRPVIPSQARTGTAIGAALLFRASTGTPHADATAEQPDPALADYAKAWHKCMSGPA